MLSVVSNSFLVLLKLTVGVLIGSVAVISEAIHSGVDLVASFIALFAIGVAGKPADKGHPFGHGKAENISGTVEALLIFAAAGWIIFEAVRKLIRAEHVQAIGWGVAIMLVSTIANLAVSHRLFKVGRETHSMALIADAWHLRTDVWTSVGVMASLLAIWVGEALFPRAYLHWLDPAAALLVAAMIIKAAYQLTLESGKDLMDASLPVDEEMWIREYISSFRPVVRGFHKLKTRKSGRERFVEVHLLVQADMSVEESHRITDIISDQIKIRFPHSNVLIHIEPCSADCSPECVSDCLMTEAERERLAKEEGGEPLLPVTE